MRFVIARLLILGTLTSLMAFAGIIEYDFTGEQMPSPNIGPSNFLGTTCANPTTTPCIFQGGQTFEIFSAKLVQNTATNWTLPVNTNAPTGGSDGFSAFAF